MCMSFITHEITDVSIIGKCWFTAVIKGWMAFTKVEVSPKNYQAGIQNVKLFTHTNSEQLKYWGRAKYTKLDL